MHAQRDLTASVLNQLRELPGKSGFVCGTRESVDYTPESHDDQRVQPAGLAGSPANVPGQPGAAQHEPAGRRGGDFQRGGGNSRRARHVHDVHGLSGRGEQRYAEQTGARSPAQHHVQRAPPHAQGQADVYAAAHSWYAQPQSGRADHTGADRTDSQRAGRAARARASPVYAGQAGDGALSARAGRDDGVAGSVRGDTRASAQLGLEHRGLGAGNAHQHGRAGVSGLEDCVRALLAQSPEAELRRNFMSHVAFDRLLGDADAGYLDDESIDAWARLIAGPGVGWRSSSLPPTWASTSGGDARVRRGLERASHGAPVHVWACAFNPYNHWVLGLGFPAARCLMIYDSLARRGAALDAPSLAWAHVAIDMMAADPDVRADGAAVSAWSISLVAMRPRQAGTDCGLHVCLGLAAGLKAAAAGAVWDGDLGDTGLGPTGGGGRAVRIAIAAMLLGLTGVPERVAVSAPVAPLQRLPGAPALELTGALHRRLVALVPPVGARRVADALPASTAADWPSGSRGYVAAAARRTLAAEVAAEIERFSTGGPYVEPVCGFYTGVPAVRMRCPDWTHLGLSPRASVALAAHALAQLPGSGPHHLLVAGTPAVSLASACLAANQHSLCSLTFLVDDTLRHERTVRDAGQLTDQPLTAYVAPAWAQPALMRDLAGAGRPAGLTLSLGAIDDVWALTSTATSAGLPAYMASHAAGVAGSLHPESCLLLWVGSPDVVDYASARPPPLRPGCNFVLVYARADGPALVWFSAPGQLTGGHPSVSTGARQPHASALESCDMYKHIASAAAAATASGLVAYVATLSELDGALAC